MSPKIKYQLIASELPLFIKPWWLDTVCDNGWDVVILEEDEKIIAVWPYQVEKKMGLKIFRNPLLTAYTGPIIIAENNFSQIESSAIFLKKIPKAALLQWTSSPFSKAILFEDINNLIIKKRRTFYIPLNKSVEELWRNISRGKRGAIKKAEEELIITKNYFEVDSFTLWHRRSFEEKGKKYPYSKKFLSKIMHTTALNNASMSFSIADKSGKIIGQIWLAYDNNVIYYLLSASSKEAHRGAISLLIWNAILEAKKMGLKFFDFEGSMDEGIATFFSRFGGNEIAYYDYEMNNSFLWKLKKKLRG